MAIANFPFEFTTIDNSKVIVDKVKDEAFSFRFSLTDKKGHSGNFSWTPSKAEIRDNQVKKTKEYTDEQYNALAGFWSIYND